MSDSLWPHEWQHIRPLCPSPTPRVHWNSCPSSWWCHPAILSSVVTFSSCPQSLPASGSFPRSQQSKQMFILRKNPSSFPQTFPCPLFMIHPALGLECWARWRTAWIPLHISNWVRNHLTLKSCGKVLGKTSISFFFFFIFTVVSTVLDKKIKKLFLSNYWSS